MKNILLFIGIVLLFASCDPIEKRKELGAILSPSQINITAENTTAGGNQIILKNSTPNVGGTWYYGGGISYKQVDTILLAALGTTTIKFIATTPGGVVEKTVDVNVDLIDHIIPVFDELTGGGPGRTWVYADDFSDDDNYPDGGYCFMVASYDYTEFWWNPYGSSPSADFGGEMEFKLSGFEYTLNFHGSTTTGTYNLDNQAMVLTIVNPYILDYNEPNCNPDATATGRYEILKLTHDELILAQMQGDWGYTWIWIFKRKGYSYPDK